VILVPTIPWLINKNPMKNLAPDFHSLHLWLTVNLVLVAANASHALWAAVWFGLAATLIVTALALWGDYWPAKT